MLRPFLLQWPVLALLAACGSDPDADDKDWLGEDSGSVDDIDCVAPTLDQAPALAQRVGPLDTMVLRAEGSVAVEVLSGGTLSGTVLVDPVAGEAVFSDLSTDAAGVWTLSFSEVDCEEATTVSLVVGTEVHYEPVFLETGRVGVEYADGLSADVVQDLPAGLTLSSDTVYGVPETASEGIFSAARLNDSVATRLRVHLPIIDGLEGLPDIVPEDDGDWAVIEEARLIDSITTSRGERTDVAVWVTRPDGTGPFPMVAFHHAAHYPADIYDHYTSLHRHWASHGFIVASVDSSANVIGVPQSWQNLSDMSTFQLAAADMMLAESADPTSDLFGAVDPDRVFVSGHSRGGGASLISLWARPSLMGAVCFEQVSPLQAPNQDWDDPARNGNRPFPERPVLIFSAANDLDEAWPLVDSAFDQLTGPSTLVTLHGTNHEYTYDADTPGSYTSSSSISFDERHALDQRWSTAFLRRHAYGEIGWDALLHGPEGLESDLSTPGVSTHSRLRIDTEILVDDFAGDTEENLMGGENASVALDTDTNAPPYTAGLTAAGRGGTIAEVIAEWTTARHLTWSDPAGTVSFGLGEPLDLMAQQSVVLRIARDCPPPTAVCETGWVDFDVVLTDAAGARVAVPVTTGLGEKGIVGRHWSNAILPLDAFSGVDLSSVQTVELDLGTLGIEAGDLWIDDLRFE